MVFFFQVGQIHAQFDVRKWKFRLIGKLSQFRLLRGLAAIGARFPQPHGRVAVVRKLGLSIDAWIGTHFGEPYGRRVAFLRQHEWRRQGGDVSELWEQCTN
jgi:hypothetical protein